MALEILFWDVYVSAHNSFSLRIPVDYKPDLETNNLKIYINDKLDTLEYDAEIILIDERKKILKYDLRVTTDI